MEGKTAIITGGTGGAGSEISRLYAEEGANVVIAACGEETGEALAANIRAKGREAVFVKTDVEKEDDVKACVRAAVNTYSTVDILVNIACIMSLDTGYLHECSAEDFDKDISINLKGAFLFAKYVLPMMKDQGAGVIINFSSIGGSRGALGHTVYGTAKAGLESMTHSITAQYGKQGIRCNCIRPGIMTNPTWSGEGLEEYKEFMLSHMPCPRIGTGADAAPLALFLACDDSYYVNGQINTLDGGMTSHELQWKKNIAPENAGAL